MVKTEIIENMQKLWIAGIPVNEPTKNEKASVTDVRVMLAPACARPTLNLTSAGKCIGV